MNDLNDVMVFARVAREQSFTRAARSLGLPKSTVSERVARLEARLGVRLLERTTRTLRLTEAGAGYYDRVARLAQDLDEADRAVAAAHHAPRGLLRVASPLLFAQAFLADVVADYLGRYPEVRVELVAADRPFDLVEEGFDLGVHVLGPVDAALAARKLGAGERWCVAAPSYLAARGAPREPADLAAHDAIVAGSALAGPWSFRRKGAVANVTVAPRYTVTSVELAARATLRGLGVAVLPSFLCAGAVGDGGLVRLFDDWSAGETSVYLVYPSNRHLSARVRAFADLVVERTSYFPSRGFRAGP
jgi:DNA-binding transcriptional LysR family regulator